MSDGDRFAVFLIVVYFVVGGAAVHMFITILKMYNDIRAIKKHLRIEDKP